MSVAAHLDETPQDDAGSGAGPERTRAARRELHLETMGETAEGSETNVTVHNVSASGMLMESRIALAEGEVVDVDLPLAGMVRARVVWASGQLFGCRFDTALSPSTLSAAQLRSAVLNELDFGARRDLVPDEGFAARLHRLRAAAGLTMAALAEKLGVSKPTVWAWEQGKARPVGSRIEALAAALGVPQSELVAGQDDAAVRDALERARQQIARAVGTSPERIRISIEL